MKLSRQIHIRMTQFEESMDFIRKSAGKANVHDGLFTEATNTDAILSYLDQNN